MRGDGEATLESGKERCRGEPKAVPAVALKAGFTAEAQRPQRTASEGKPAVTVPPFLALPCLLTEERFFHPF